MVRLSRPSPALVDAVLAAMVGAFAISSAALSGGKSGEPNLTVVGALLLSGTAVPLIWRRRAPVRVWLATGLATGTYGVAELPDPLLPLGGLVALYTVVALADRRTGIAVAAASIGLGVIFTALAGDSDALDYYAAVVVTGLAWALGEIQRTRQAYLAEVHARLVRAERDRADEAQRVVAQERGRIARELHDVVAHHVSMIVVQSEAAASTAERAGGAAGPSFDAIASTGREALAELRRLLGMLRDEHAVPAVAPQPVMADLEALVDQVRDAGLPIDLRIEGEPRPLPPGVDLSAYRIVQEALTNTLRHAGPATAYVVVRFDDDGLVVEVTDDGCGPGGANGSNIGHGLLGMQERVALFGGSLATGARPGGGFSVRARLPTRG